MPIPRLCQTRCRMRVVLDTNILISACLKPGGLEARTVALACQGAFTVCVSVAVMAEYSDVLGRPKFSDVSEEAQRLLEKIRSCALAVAAGPDLTVAADEDDNRLLECAVGCGASYLVTGNLRHFPTQWDSVRIVNARQFLDAEFGN